MTSTHAFWLAGRQSTGEATFDVTSPWDGRLVGQVSVPTEAQAEEAVAVAPLPYGDWWRRPESGSTDE
jgi:aldehyde dehydrogenase (NAD+)